MRHPPEANPPNPVEEGLESDELFPIVYQELRRMAAARMSHESPNQTIQPTALVHEAWIRLTGGENISWKNRGHFFGAAAQAMRRILVERARRKAALKRRPDPVERNGLFGDVAAVPDDYILMLNESLRRLESENPEAARVVLLKFFSGLRSAEIAEMTGQSIRGVERLWTFAKARLYQMIREEGFCGEQALKKQPPSTQ